MTIEEALYTALMVLNNARVNAHSLREKKNYSKAEELIEKLVEQMEQKTSEEK